MNQLMPSPDILPDGTFAYDPPSSPLVSSSIEPTALATPPPNLIDVPSPPKARRSLDEHSHSSKRPRTRCDQPCESKHVCDNCALLTVSKISVLADIVKKRADSCAQLLTQRTLIGGSDRRVASDDEVELLAALERYVRVALESDGIVVADP